MIREPAAGERRADRAHAIHSHREAGLPGRVAFAGEIKRKKNEDETAEAIDQRAHEEHPDQAGHGAKIFDE
jgi:hypothetical protein